jgi:hypothetical protein
MRVASVKRPVVRVRGEDTAAAELKTTSASVMRVGVGDRSGASAGLCSAASWTDFAAGADDIADISDLLVAVWRSFVSR